MLYVVGDVVRGVTYLDNIMYVICAWSSTIRLYNTETYSPLAVVIDITGLNNPCDIVVCRHDRQLYVADCDCIWRVSVDDHSYVKWLTTRSSTTRPFYKLSTTSRRLLVTSSRPPTVRQYSTTNNELLCVVQLPQYVTELYHAVETTHNTFVIGHQDMRQCAVSELFRFCHIGL